MFNKTVKRTTNVVHNPPDTIFTVLNTALKFWQDKMTWQLTKAGGYSKEDADRNLATIGQKIENIESIVKNLAEKGITEDIHKQIKDIQSTVGDLYLTGKQ